MGPGIIAIPHRCYAVGRRGVGRITARKTPEPSDHAPIRVLCRRTQNQGIAHRNGRIRHGLNVRRIEVDRNHRAAGSGADTVVIECYDRYRMCTGVVRAPTVAQGWLDTPVHDRIIDSPLE